MNGPKRDRCLTVAAGPSYRKHACHPREDLRAEPDFATRLAGTLAARLGGLRAPRSRVPISRAPTSRDPLASRAPLSRAARPDEPRDSRLARNMSIRSITLPPFLAAGFSANEIS